MAQTIKIDQLADTVMKGMEEYAKLAAEDLKKDVQKAGKTVKRQIESTAPKKTGKYSKSWVVKDSKEVQTESLEITATPLPSGLVKVKTGANTTDEVYNGWYSAVYQSPTTEPTEQGQG